MKIISIIGTRPQYIKIKPIHDYCNLNKINHKIIDTKQHYSDNVSKLLIEDLELKIDISLNLENINEIDFICKLTRELSIVLKNESPDIILIYGDTNSTFCAALAAYKLGIDVAHIEAGERCFDNTVPEEINRIFSDSISKFNFCSSELSAKNIEGIFCGDLEYNLLNFMNPSIKYKDYGVMTIHRQSNCSKDRVKKIMKMCEGIDNKIKFYAHHRIRPLIDGNAPKNVEVYDSCSYSEMVRSLSECKFIITDSGSIQKTSPFFGKRTLVMRKESEWKKTEASGFAKIEKNNKEDIEWLLAGALVRDKKFYMTSDGFPAEIIMKKVLGSYEQ